jgi:acetyltransferase-like isoleucine patch superfamily enzyme
VSLLGGGKFGAVKIGFNRDCNNGAPSIISINGKLILRGDKHSFGAGCLISVSKNAILDIGNNFGCTGDTGIHISKYMKIGDNNLWSYGCHIMDSDFHRIYNAKGELINPNNSVIFGDNVWMGCNCLILKGAVIPSHNVIAAGSRIGVVLKEENCVITTNGRILKANITWKS